MQDQFPGAAAGGFVRVGAYSLEVGAQGSFARFDPHEERENAHALAAALDQQPDQRPAVIAAVEDFQESADAVTGRIEQADTLLRDAAAGRLLDIGNVSGEIDALLDLCARLDSEGRFEEQLRLMRSLNGLLSLSMRWLELIRSLWSLLRSAEAAGHAAAQAFAQHELGSLNLCAGRPRKALEHLERASQLERRIGDLAGSCATRHNIDAARRDLALRSRPWFRRPGTAQRLVILAGALAIAGGSGAGLALAIHGGGGTGAGGGRAKRATLIVHKDFIPNSPRSVTVTVACTNGGRPDSAPKTATEAAPAVFKITGLAAGAMCTASEPKAPAGYSKVQADCRDISIAAGETRSCTITNRRRGLGSGTLTVNTQFAPSAPGSSANVSVSCTNGGKPDRAAKRATGTAPARFTITRLKKGATCSAAESPAPSGYSADDHDCQRRAIGSGSAITCTIVNTRNRVTSAIFKVAKHFSDNNPASVTIGLTCSSGNVAGAQPAASEALPATFTITGFRPGSTCTATERASPSGYTADESDCARKAIADGVSVSCTITNTTKTTLTVQKDFTDGNPATVSVRLQCSSGSIDVQTQQAAVGSPAVFTITGFDSGATCTATEAKVPAGYSGDESDCRAVPLVTRSECTIVNSPPG